MTATTAMELQATHYRTEEEYILSGTVGVEFWANPAQLEREVERAKKVFARRMYGEIESLVHEVMNAVNDEDRDRAMQICGMILDCTKGER